MFLLKQKRYMMLMKQFLTTKAVRQFGCGWKLKFTTSLTWMKESLFLCLTLEGLPVIHRNMKSSFSTYLITFLNWLRT